ncbi:MAG: endonuclease III [Ruminococcaceae bacterium]|nr:endonuclease III [Oscillospiraceae bacterium]MBO4972555.1 endonuclease III [Clostridia bacterium]MBQ1260080.1 endonuclease III [Clostridia bacterium]
MTKKQRITLAAEILERVYPSAECALKYEGEAWKLLVMGRLSAQCTDERVNIVCEELFSVFPTPESLADAPVEDIERIVRPCGLYHTKAESIKQSMKKLVTEHEGVLPDEMDTLLEFPGVGRKIANLLLGDIYGKGGIVADTHCIRICGRLGMYEETLKDPHKVELIMDKLIARDKQSDFCHRIVLFGREYCNARNPKCSVCPLAEVCKKNSKRA